MPSLDQIVRDRVGTIFGRAGVARFSMHVEKGKSIQKGQFLIAVGDGRIILSRVIDIETRVTETIGQCEILGECEDSTLKQCNKPVRAGYEIYNPSGEFLSKLITRTTKEEGLFIGRILTHPDFVPVYYRPKDLRVHVLVSATTGGGKSYTLSVFIEELIKKMRKNKNFSIIIFDVHDEYSGFVMPNQNEKQVKALKEFNLKPEGFENDILIFDWENNPPYLSPIFSPDRLMFIFSMKELRLALQLRQLMGEKPQMHIDELYRLVEISDLHFQTKQALLTRIGSLRASGFLSYKYIKPNEYCVPGKVTIFRLIGTPLGDLGIRFFVADIVRQVFEEKKLGKIKHNVILVVDEAHLFAPAKGKDDPVKEILIRVAREGRKMGVWLILATQSPRDLSDVIIINCSTIIALKMQRHDISKLSQLFGIPKKLVEVLTSVSPGECFMKAPSFTIPLMVKVRPRQSSELKADYVNYSELIKKVQEVAKRTKQQILKLRKERVVEKKPTPPSPPQPKPTPPGKIPEPSPPRVYETPRKPPRPREPRYPPRPPTPTKHRRTEDETLEFVVNIFADQIMAYDYAVYDLIRALLTYGAIDIYEALHYVSETILDSLVADDIIRLTDSKVMLNLDKKIEEYTGKRLSDAQLEIAKRKLKSLLNL